ncbi:8221_t:CDS:10 [Diversispora eburnea]|uniref:8221_t:CDS:1 n=1 Tax=Diversispora eburnea TaxID=1213867 RepID=A0A9N8ZLR9_9GLOM|nr:8221_t:CDS:10 [Diversispora eburnea]
MTIDNLDTSEDHQKESRIFSVVHAESKIEGTEEGETEGGGGAATTEESSEELVDVKEAIDEACKPLKHHLEQCTERVEAGGTHENYKRDSELLATVVTIGALTLCLSTIALFPVDIFLVSSTTNSETGLKHSWATKDVVESIVGEIKSVYYVGERSISFVMAVLMVLGMTVSITYTAPGLSLLPVKLIVGMRKFKSDSTQKKIDDLLKINQEKQRVIRAKYSNVNSNMMSRVDTKQLEKLRTEERILKRTLREFDVPKTGLRYIWDKILLILRPFEFIGGVILLILTIVLILSMFLTCSTIIGVISIGIRFLWITLFKIRRQATPPQGLLFAASLLMLSLLALNYTLTMVVTPQYAQFGSQKYCNLTHDDIRDCTDYPQLIIPCDVTAPTDICTPTVISTFLHQIMMNTPFFGIILYYAQWVFLAVAGLSFIYSVIRMSLGGNKYYLSDDGDERDEYDEGEEEALLGGGRSIEVIE